MFALFNKYVWLAAISLNIDLIVFFQLIFPHISLQVSGGENLD